MLLSANLMSLIQSAKLDGHDLCMYLEELLERLPTQPANRLDERVAHRWRALS